MKTRHLAIFLSAISFLAAFGTVHAAAPVCPDTALGETQEDCPWAGIARTLIEETESGHALLPVLKANAPRLVAQIEADAKAPWKNMWGRSINYDEFAKGIIVHPAVLSAIGEIFGIPMETDEKHRVHAGMEHTYGYLFSVLKTSFGYKRARWVRNQIEDGFELERGLLGPEPSSGTLLGNVTFFIGRIAFQNEPKMLETLNKEASRVAPAIAKFNYSKLSPVRLEEEVEAPQEKGELRNVMIRTDLVPFTKISGPNTHLLVYSILDSNNDASVPQLITAFPVESSFVQKVINPADLGTKPVITRYNAYVEGVTGSKLTGKRRITPAQVPKTKKSR